jgi:outer membrane biosynthesis protein TonB
MTSPGRKKDKQLGWLISFAIHAMVVILFFLINAWKAPNPPMPEYGIELNIGIEQEGFGEEQPITPPVSPEEQASEAQPEEPTEEPEQVEQETSPAVEETIPDSKEVDSPVEAKPEVKPKPEEPKPKVEEKPKPTETKPKVEEKKVETKAMYPGAAGQGTKQGQTGDAGNPQGTIEGKALYGTPGGGGGGPTLEMAGWRWNSEPKVTDKSTENGRIVFEIKVDDNGDIISVKTLEKTVSPTVEQIYRKEVEKLSFSPTTENSNPPPLSSGKITFIIRSN